MNQEERSERSRAQILEAALKLFSHRGYGATSVRDIAEDAGVSKGNVYHHFTDKETIFRELLDQYFRAMSNPEFPFNRALAEGTPSSTSTSSSSMARTFASSTATWPCASKCS
jgi:AcrR family transcriptional regulator